jgi:hypothetical protein
VADGQVTVSCWCPQSAKRPLLKPLQSQPAVPAASPGPLYPSQPMVRNTSGMWALVGRSRGGDASDCGSCDSLPRAVAPLGAAPEAGRRAPLSQPSSQPELQSWSQLRYQQLAPRSQTQPQAQPLAAQGSSPGRQPPVASQLFPFELSNTDYSHRALDLVKELMMHMYNGAVAQGVLQGMPTVALRGEDDVDAYELLHFALEWPCQFPSRGAFLQYLFGGQRAISSYPVFCTTFDSHLEKLVEHRSGVVHLLATHQPVSGPVVTHFMAMLLSLAVILDDEPVRGQAEALMAQFEAHDRSKRTRMQVSHEC